MTNAARIFRFHLLAYGGFVLCAGVAALCVLVAGHIPSDLPQPLRGLAPTALLVVFLAAVAVWVLSLPKFNKCGKCGAPLTRLADGRHAPFVYWNKCQSCGQASDAPLD